MQNWWVEGAWAVVAWMEMWLHKDIKAWHTRLHTHTLWLTHTEDCADACKCGQYTKKRTRRPTATHTHKHTHTHEADAHSLLDLRLHSSWGWGLNRDIERALERRREDGPTSRLPFYLHSIPPSLLLQEPAIPRYLLSPHSPRRSLHLVPYSPTATAATTSPNLDGYWGM